MIIGITVNQNNLSPLVSDFTILFDANVSTEIIAMNFTIDNPILPPPPTTADIGVNIIGIYAEIIVIHIASINLEKTLLCKKDIST